MYKNMSNNSVFCLSICFFGGGRVVLIGETDICYLDGKPEK